MGKCFNVNGICYPDENYMVPLDDRLKQIKVLVDKGQYFVINRARQYGKTTTLWALNQYLREEYAVISIGFQRLSTNDFLDEYAFSQAFADIIIKTIRNKKKSVSGLDMDVLDHLGKNMKDAQRTGLRVLFEYLSELCDTSEKPVVLIVDEVDSATNNQVFVDFLGQLRDRYLDRRETATFHSVILAGVYDIKNLKQKLRPEDQHRYNSPWNIAADFDIAMSFSVKDISNMLEQFEAERHTGMDIPEMSQIIFDYTSGYPYLVSYICKLLDEYICGNENFSTLQETWTKEGIFEAVKEIMKRPSTLFDDMKKKLQDYPELYNMLYAILFQGHAFPFNPDSQIIDVGIMFGFLKEYNGQVCVANRIFEMRLYNYFLSEEMLDKIAVPQNNYDKNLFVVDGYLDMDRVMMKFYEYFSSVYNKNDTKFIEENGRKIFLMYLKPIINGTGNYYVESRTRDMRRTDVIVDYRGRQYVIEMKIYHGEEYNRRGEEQLLDYLDSYHLDKGYLLSFNFNRNKKAGVQTIVSRGKTIMEVVV